MMIYSCTKVHENISNGFKVIEGLDLYHSKFSKGHNSIQRYVELWSLFSEHLLIMLYICTKFHSNI